MHVRRVIASWWALPALWIVGCAAQGTDPESAPEDVAVAQSALEGIGNAVTVDRTNTGVISFETIQIGGRQRPESLCGGSVLNVPQGDLVLTARHCVQDLDGRTGFPTLAGMVPCALRLDSRSDL